MVRVTWNRDWIVAALLLAVHAAMLAYSAQVQSPTLNELAHLVAGISHWKFGRFEVYRTNPLPSAVTVVDGWSQASVVYGWFGKKCPTA